MKKTIKNITLIRLMQLFIVAILIITAIIALAYRAFFQNVIENEALTIASSVKAGLTSHMKANIIDKKQYFLDEITNINNIEKIRIINTRKNNFQKTENILKVLKTKKFSFQWDDIGGKFNATIPYIANSQGTLNCLSCHDAQEGEILGLIDMQIDISSAQELVLKYGYFLVIMLVFFSIIILITDLTH